MLRYAKLVRCSSRFGLRQAGGGPLSKASSKWSRTASELAARATHEEEPQQPRSRRRPSNGCSGVEREDNLGRLYLGADTHTRVQEPAQAGFWEGESTDLRAHVSVARAGLAAGFAEASAYRICAR